MKNKSYHVRTPNIQKTIIPNFNFKTTYNFTMQPICILKKKLLNFKKPVPAINTQVLKQNHTPPPSSQTPTKKEPLNQNPKPNSL